MTPLRFVILRHEGIEEPHFDLMFETCPGGALRTWRSDEWPLTFGDPLEELKMHRSEYLEYEGPISGNRGFVRRVDSGTYTKSRDQSDRLDGTFADGTRFAFICPSDGRWWAVISRD